MTSHDELKRLERLERQRRRFLTMEAQLRALYSEIETRRPQNQWNEIQLPDPPPPP